MEAAVVKNIASKVWNLTAVGGRRHSRNDAGGVPASADIFTFDYGANGIGNFDSVDPSINIDWTLTVLPGSGPRGLDAYELNLIPQMAAEQEWGHGKALPALAQNVWRYYRWYHWFHPTTNFRADLGNGSKFTNKQLIIGADERMIFNLDGSPDASDWAQAGHPRVVVLFDGEECQPYLPHDEDPSPWDIATWLPVQLGIRHGLGVAAIKLWINNDNFSAPTLATPEDMDFVIGSSGSLLFGGYHNHNLLADGVYRYRHAGFRVATTFDDQWATWMNG